MEKLFHQLQNGDTLASYQEIVIQLCRTDCCLSVELSHPERERESDTFSSPYNLRTSSKYTRVRREGGKSDRREGVRYLPPLKIGTSINSVYCVRNISISLGAEEC